MEVHLGFIKGMEISVLDSHEGSLRKRILRRPPFGNLLSIIILLKALYSPHNISALHPFFLTKNCTRNTQIMTWTWIYLYLLLQLWRFQNQKAGANIFAYMTIDVLEEDEVIPMACISLVRSLVFKLTTFIIIVYLCVCFIHHHSEYYLVY